MHHWWWRNSLARWKHYIRGELIWGWDALLAATFRRCERCEGIWGRAERIFLRCWKNCAHISGRRSRGKSGESDSRTREQCADHIARVKRLQRATWQRRWDLPFAFAAHFAPEYLYAAAQLYRDHFRPSEVLRKPYLMVAVQVIAAETDALARRLFTTPQQRFLRLIRNQPVELLPPVDSMEPLWQDGERAAVENRLRAAIVGSDATVKAGLEKLVARHRR